MSDGFLSHTYPPANSAVTTPLRLECCLLRALSGRPRSTSGMRRPRLRRPTRSTLLVSEARLQLQSLWRIPTAAVSEHVFGRKVAHFDGAAAENAGFGEVRAQMWTATRHDGPNHLIACGATCPPAQQLALITSDRAVMRASRASTSPNHLGSCCDARPPSIKSPE